MGFNKKEYQKKYYQNNKKKLLEKQKEYYNTHKEDRIVYMKQYYNNKKEVFATKNKKYYTDNTEVIKEQRKQYYSENKEVILEKMKNKYKTLRGYCCNSLRNYIKADREHGRIGDELPQNYITLDFLMEAVQQPCFYKCGEHDWHNMGIDRIDNSRPHTIDNVVPCCTKCNKERSRKDFDEFYTTKIGEAS